MTATLYYDLGSPYAYLAVERAERVLDAAAQLQPVLLGAIFKLRERGSWATLAESRATRMAEVEQRAASYGLPPVDWPAGWPNNTLRAMRAATWAQRRGAGERFARLAFRRAFVEAGDLSDVDVLREVAQAARLDPGEMVEATDSGAIKEQLREVTSAAWAAGVRGVPTLLAGGRAFYGDDQLENAAAHLAATTASC